MAVSKSTQNGLYGNHADRQIHADDIDHANTLIGELRSDTDVRMARIQKYNNGSRIRPIWVYRVDVWFTPEALYRMANRA